MPNFNEEMVCDLVSSINDFINEVVEPYKKENNNENNDKSTYERKD